MAPDILERFLQFITLVEKGEKPKMLTLDQVEAGDKVQVTGFAGHSRNISRLAEMGVIAGAIIEVKHIAPLGDPMALRIKDSQLSIRKTEAKKILVRAY